MQYLAEVFMRDILFNNQHSVAKSICETEIDAEWFAFNIIENIKAQLCCKFDGDVDFICANYSFVKRITKH